MTRRSGDTERETRLNPNVQNVFFMRAESIVIWSFLFVAEWAESEQTKRYSLSGNKRRGTEGKKNG